MSWTSEKVEKLKELWSKGHTASQIAELLGDTTRNAVIGKAHRLNLEARAPSKQSNATRTRENKGIKSFKLFKSRYIFADIRSPKIMPIPPVNGVGLL